MNFGKNWIGLVLTALLFSCSDGNKPQAKEEPTAPVATTTSQSHTATPFNSAAAAPKPAPQGNAISGLVTNVFSPPVGTDGVKSQLLFIDTGKGNYRQALVCFGSGTGNCKVATSGVAPADVTAGYLNREVMLFGMGTTSVTTSTGTYKPVVATAIQVNSPVPSPSK
jgi:hypothetical protein